MMLGIRDISGTLLRRCPATFWCLCFATVSLQSYMKDQVNSPQAESRAGAVWTAVRAA
jgi:hypothetical protein